VRPATSGDPPTRYAPGGIEAGSCRARSTNADRTRRRTRLRVTAPPVRRPNAQASRGGRGGSAGSSGSTRIQIGPERTRRPPWRRATNVDRSEMRPIRPTACSVPCDGVPSPRHGRRGPPCDAGSRGGGHDGGCWAEMCASRNSLLDARDRQTTERGPSPTSGPRPGRRRVFDHVGRSRWSTVRPQQWWQGTRMDRHGNAPTRKRRGVPSKEQLRDRPTSRSGQGHRGVRDPPVDTRRVAR